MTVPDACREDPRWDATEDGISALEVEVVEPIRWSQIPGEDAIEIQMDSWGSVSIVRDRVRHILEGLEAGENLPGIVRRLDETNAYASRAAAERNARNIILGLAGQGNVEIHLPPVPQAFGGRYERIEELGRGAVGVAWLCKDLEAGERRVVVKHAWNWSGSLQRRDENLRQEADLMASLDHPGIVDLVDRVEIEGRFHLVRDFVEGRPLDDRILEDGAMPRDRRRSIVSDVTGILDHLHERSIWCMDLSPGNLMLKAGTGRTVLADLGHCRRVEREQIALERIPGTTGYLGPEVFENHTATKRLDIYGLGKLLEFMTTAYPPKQSESVDAVLERMRERGDPSDAELTFVEACLEREPGARPRSASEALRHLEG